ncbi:zinc finger CCCH domain-containing protein 3 isoform X3 [Coffea eugenioides]|uniref:Zinc finger CCCH domain-containing protein 3-like isoform X3 n=1 Tax=Coffea arabica TaxID=13443 RepID=A0ABM4WZ93_COFAR|nr:zinc finger CCCH domain-containing protein 3 isoform X3 [Coffea eugenioides]XP_027157368.1 zinc finger CCCH domain-containing protein 3 isoform X3 [Coffea eugenioides]XP_027157369.1 zinc finger CCCH domain-containing protein 3 isoform X3 [Coffea eugenioides]XP_027157370.1 zinc finger CCCH domain-containing protein 3 isoform X3 [Coffea eugenioides]
MPLGKYYCDYCDKEFQDTAAARKRHLQGVHHQRAKALWYDSLRSDANQIPAPGALGKQGVCNRFVRTGSCQYGDSCKYYHPKQNPNDQVLPDIQSECAYFMGQPTSILDASSRSWISSFTLY